MLLIEYMRGATRCAETVERGSLRSWMYAHADCVVLRSVPVS